MIYNESFKRLTDLIITVKKTKDIGCLLKLRERFLNFEVDRVRVIKNVRNVLHFPRRSSEGGGSGYRELRWGRKVGDQSSQTNPFPLFVFQVSEKV